ncbi:16S rRNA (guanine(527)-N(7))-methyltransferase RsmG [Spiroplasma endosymbiont of Anurida maritima]|uniref:16S rRNA (guanine(527)-N(7))-methyltransferase RsmG n=1 Tax=Spiroplasma endosymbiont of Anurida maritima TaxID=2967972 RepID=UPI0036D22F92
MKNQIKDLFLQNLEIDLSETQIKQFITYYEFLVKKNQEINLTAITKWEDVLNKHFLDCALLIKYYDLNDKNILDIGAGAGFPSIVLKILVPSLKVTIVESLLKRCNFLDELIVLLDLSFVKIVNERAEVFATKQTEVYDCVLSRAVSTLPVILELSTRYLKIKGDIIAYKSQKHEEELSLSKGAIQHLFLRHIDTFLENEQDFGVRAFMIFKKMKQTPNIYPRSYNKIKKQPL